MSTTRTITLTGRPPVTIREDDWHVQRGLYLPPGSTMDDVENGILTAVAQMKDAVAERHDDSYYDSCEGTGAPWERVGDECIAGLPAKELL